MIDVDKVRAEADLADVVGRYVKLRKSGKEYVGCCPFHHESTPSFTVSPAGGFVHCFGCGAHHDVIGFVMRVAGVGFIDACAELGAGVEALAPARRQQAAIAKRGAPDVVWVPICPVPATAEVLEAGKQARIWNPKRGTWWWLKPQRADAYRDADGRLLGYVLRVMFDDGKKVTPQITWCIGPDGTERWCSQPFPEPRPLCGLDGLAAKPKAPVLVVEGEKCRAAGAGALRMYAAICWPGGSKALGKVDWSPLAGRELVLWPDADEPGWMAMLGGETYDGRWVDGVAQYADRAGAASVRVIDTRGCAKGWDIADALQIDRWTPRQLAGWAASRVRGVDFQDAARAA